MAPLVSVVTAVRNGVRFLPPAIESIRAQTLEDWEHIFVDDASDDNTVAVVERAAEADSRIRLIRRSKRGGPYVALNDGLASAAGTYFANIDADDEAPPTRLETQVRFLRDNPHLRACSGFHRVLTSEGDLKPSIVRVPVLPGVLRWRLCAGVDPVHSSVFVERSAMEELGGYAPLPRSQDWRLWSELSRRGWLGIVPAVVAHRRVHEGQITATDQSRQTRFALEVAQEHIRRLTAEEWSISDVGLLREATHGRAVRARDGLRILERWRDHWRSDPSLAPEERAELERWTSRVKRRHLIRWAERVPVGGVVVSAGSRAGRAALRVGAQLSRPLRGPRSEG